MMLPSRPTRLVAALLLGAVSCVAFASSAAIADTVKVADASAQNVTGFLDSSAWSRRVSDSQHRLVVMGPSGIPEDAAVASSAVPFDPDIGPTTAHGGRAVVYTRCTDAARRRGCDVYLYDIGARIERKVTKVSSTRADEVAPSYFKGAIAFGRYGSRGGLYLAIPGRPVKQMRSFGIVDETDISATRIIARTDTGAITEITVVTRGGRERRTVGIARRTDNGGTEVLSPILSFYRAWWLQRDTDKVRAVAQTVSLRSPNSTVSEVDRPFADPRVNAFALGPYNLPTLYSGTMGISLIDPLFRLY